MSNLLLTEFALPRQSDIKSAADRLFNLLSNDPAPEKVFFEVKRLNAYGYKVAVTKDNGGALVVRTKRPGQLYHTPELKKVPIEDDPRYRKYFEVLRLLEFPSRITSDNLEHAKRIGKLRARVWRGIEAERAKYAD